jgi:hypothetical protein
MLAGSRGGGGAAIGGICGGACIGGGGGVEGARAVAASGEASPAAIDPGGASPMGGVGGAMRGASRCPHSWQNVRWVGLSRPHVEQTTAPDGTPTPLAQSRSRRAGGHYRRSLASTAMSMPTK